MAETLIMCENLVKIYRVPEAQVEVIALQGLDLEVSRGEFLAIVGRSGSGKTTLLNILGALEAPSAGMCTVAGYHVSHLSAREQDVYRRFVAGHVWQRSSGNLAPDLTIQHNVDLPQVLAGAPRRQRRVRTRRLLEITGLGEKSDRRPAQLSGGEQQRAAIAVALANEPELVLADEPTGDLDSPAALELVALLGRLAREHGLTVVLVTHDPAVAALADRTVAIRDGRASMETVQRPLGVSESAHDDGPEPVAIIDRTGLLQLPESTLAAVELAGRAELIIRGDHVELWPVTAPSPAGPTTSPAVTAYRESLVVDRAGRLQLSEEALDRVPFGRRALVRAHPTHIELWPPSAREG